MYKYLIWLEGEVKTPPFSKEARIKAGFLLRELQAGKTLTMPYSRPMPSIGKKCHELRVTDTSMGINWRIVYCIEYDAIIILDVFKKKTNKTPKEILSVCRQRLEFYYKVRNG